MKTLSIACLLSALLLSIHPPVNRPTTGMQALAGSWHVVMSNFPMWLKGDKLNPKFNYTLVTRQNDTLLLDEVTYQKNGKTHRIVGYDRPLNEAQTQFVWRGKGLLAIAKSRWSVVHHNTAQGWALIEFEKTVFTPAGFDVIAQQPNLNAEAKAAVETLLNQQLPNVKLQQLAR